jgi:acyl-CoA thioester hydrolase
MNDFKLKLPLIIRFADYDLLGHVNNANYLTYFEIARIKYFEEIITGGHVDWYNEGIIVAKAIIDFRQPITGYDNYFVSIRCSRIGTKSLDFSYLITKEENGAVAIIAEGMMVMACFDYTSKQTIPVKPEWRQAIESYEGSNLS